ncbi:Slp family lipoprotein [Vibrio sp. Of7-15]|uniref:Slp family lipoprotein n=1 Tax=Vibrio sp. Of7-15 TaxID=2724879 RepID=UPI001EF346E5|nr:Slp family lipoprotein [Vibrio sp. Of7-15]MCG7495808.1 Slp family lipoprotein [Vibrio sp. Of7-15]
MKPLIIATLSLFILSACSSLPTGLQSRAENPIVDYQDLASGVRADESVVFDVRLGGVIASIDNMADKTRIEIVNLPLTSSGKPDIKQEPNDRFIAYVDGFLEPVSYAEGRLITVVGTSAGYENNKVGEYSSTVPVIEAYGHQLWRVEETVIIHNHDSNFPPCYGLYCRYYRNYLGVSKGTVTQEVKL